MCVYLHGSLWHMPQLSFDNVAVCVMVPKDIGLDVGRQMTLEDQYRVVCSKILRSVIETLEVP